MSVEMPNESVENPHKRTETFEETHRKFKELLGNKYDEQRVNGCMMLQAPGEIERITAELADSLAQVTTEEDKDRIREDWLIRHDVMAGMVAGIVD